jgi:hypothetical protein
MDASIEEVAEKETTTFDGTNVYPLFLLLFFLLTPLCPSAFLIGSLRLLLLDKTHKTKKTKNL